MTYTAAEIAAAYGYTGPVNANYAPLFEKHVGNEYVEFYMETLKIRDYHERLAAFRSEKAQELARKSFDLNSSETVMVHAQTLDAINARPAPSPEYDAETGELLETL